METLAVFLTQYSHAAIPRVSYTVSADTDLTEDSTNADVGLFANVLLRRVADSKLYGILICAPKMTMFDPVTNRGYRVKDADGQAIAQAYSACAGETFRFHEGWLQGSTLNGTLAP